MNQSVPRLGNYELLMLLASGGMANVYAARQVGAAGFQRLVVVKRVHAHLLEDRTFYDMFRDEAAMASLVRHPNVVPVTDVVEADGELFLVMDYIEGVALSTMLKSLRETHTPAPPRIGVRMVADALLGLHAAHEVVDMAGHKLELVHRDVSPHNILVGVDGISRLIDFGVAKAAHRSTQTRSGAIKGKYPYMSPEHASGDAVDRRSDIFAAAIVLHETLLGQRLFQGENDLDTLRRVIEAPIPRPSAVVPGLPAAIDTVLLKALARNADERYQTAEDFVEAVIAAIPPASHREVAAFMQEVSKGRLTERRVAIQALLDGKLAPLSVRQSRTSDDPSASNRVVPSSGWPPPSSRDGSEPSTLSERSAQGTPINHDASIVAPPLARRGRLAIGLLIAGTALIVGAIGFASTSSRPDPKRDKANATAATIALPPLPPPPSASAQVPPPDLPHDDEVDLVLIADGPIASVRVAGTKQVAIDGGQARVRVARWTGILAMDATLVSGKLAHATAAEGATGEVRLQTLTAGGGWRPTPGGRPQGTRLPFERDAGGGPPSRGGELHPSPY